MTIRFIGDIHGKITPYMDLIECNHDTVQVGDFGFGFLSERQLDRLNATLTERDRFIRGNHDDPDAIAKHPNWIEDGHYDPIRQIMYIGGAWSIDYAYRTPGLDWWAGEELSIPELMRMHAIYEYNCPRVVVTHDCPSEVAKALFGFPNDFGNYKPTRTSEALEGMWLRHRPEVWIFGHWHTRRDMVFEGTRFICLEELGHIDLDLW